MSNPRVCPLLAAGILAGADYRAGEKIQAGWDRCQGIDCAWWDQERGECAVVCCALAALEAEVGE